ncbi:hypothetical protein EUAN_19390 [Andreesenia angusta]|uniref:DUF2232 domain-containing protein n=1 Tax=Andreesenia angusta TaxID=39480 RepID=A0A1S1V550_9FIRM|nr:DUF2232 domain-containing protein [Andreesenia angusta]OHW61624.1 hypothetical protein EUAN_19390 [Andreesenia angusta]
MSNQESRTTLKDLSIAILLTSITGFFGVNGFSLLMLIFPAFSVIVGVKHGLKYSILSMAISIMAISSVQGMGYVLPLSLYIGIAAVLSIYINRRERVSKIVLAGGTYMFLALAAISVALKLIFEVDVVESLESSLRLGLKETIEQLGSASNTENYDIASIKLAMEESIGFMVAIFPVIMVSGAFMISVVSYWVASHILKRNGISHVDTLKLSNFRLSSKFSVAAVVILIVTFAIKLMGLPVYEALVLNLTTALYLVVFIQGIGVIAYFLGKTRINRAIRTTILVFLAFNVALSMFVSFVGVLDIVFNFRKIKD